MINTNFDLNALKVFMAVYENGGIEKASKKLFLSQPAVSISIKKLEEKLNGKLFIRLPKGIKPTLEGETFYHECKSAIKQISSAITGFCPQNTLQKGNLKIGANPSIIKYILMPAIKKFSRIYPNIDISFTEVISSRLEKYLINGNIDIAFMEEPIENIEIYNAKEVFLLNSCFVVCAKTKKSIFSNKMLLKNKFTVLKTNTNNRTLFEQICLKNNLSLKVSYEMANFETLHEICKNKLAIGFTFKEFVKKDIKDKKLKEIKTKINMPTSKIYALLTKNSYGSFICDEFLNILKHIKK